MSENKKKYNEPFSLKWRIYLILGLTWPLAWIPLSLGLKIGSFLGHMAFSLFRWRRLVAITNVDRVKEAGFLPASINSRDLAKESYKNMGRSGWETIRLLHRGLFSLYGNWSVAQGSEHLSKVLEEVRATNQGFILATAHSGNWELNCHALAYAFGVKLTIIGRSQDSPLVDALMTRLRTKNGNDFVFKSGGARAMVAALRHGGVLGTLVDQAAAVNNEGSLIRFMNLPAWANMGPIKLARRLKVPLMVVLLRREGKKHFLDIYPPIVKSQNPDEEEAALEDLQKLHDLIGDYIQKYPDQWLWGHKRWKIPSLWRLSPEELDKLHNTDWRKRAA